MNVLEVHDDEAYEAFWRCRVFLQLDCLGYSDLNGAFKDDIEVLALVAIMEDHRSCRMFLQAQLLAQVVISFLVVLLANFDEVLVVEEALLGLLDLLARAVLRILCQDGPQCRDRRDIFRQFLGLRPLSDPAAA